MSKANARVIRKAKQVLMTDGWTQGEMGIVGHPHCVLGAFRVAEDMPYGATEGYVWHESAAVRAFGACINRNSASTIVRWNDGLVFKVEDVLAKLEECAQREEREEA